MFWMMSPIEVWPCAWICSRLMVKTGCEVSTSARLMREPVTSILSRVWVLSWAKAAPAGSTLAASAMTTASRSLLVLQFIGFSLSAKWTWYIRIGPRVGSKGELKAQG
ncbi:hypothetical protein D3C81_1408810 [compost metagenome]